MDEVEINREVERPVYTKCLHFKVAMIIICRECQPTSITGGGRGAGAS